METRRHYRRKFSINMKIKSVKRKTMFCHRGFILRDYSLSTRNVFGYKQDRNIGRGGNKVNKT